MQHESEHNAEPGGDELPAPTEHPLEGGQTDAVDEAQEVAADDPFTQTSYSGEEVGR